MIEYKKTVCPLDCPDSCGIVATVEGGRIIELKGDPDHPFTRGFLCRKMRHYHERIHAKTRILFPQLRTGKKGAGEFKRISWDEAWDILASKLANIRAAHGGEAMLPYSYAGNMGVINRMAGYPFFHRFGASRLDQTICSTAAKEGWSIHCGNRCGTDPEVAAQSDLIVAWGINVKVTNIHFWPIIQQSRKNGGKLVVVDPYSNVTAKAADHYYPIKPSGDAALALGALKIIIERNQEDKEFIKEKSSGFQQLREYVTELSWDELERESGLTKVKIASFAELLIENPKAFFRIGIGLTRNTRGAMSVRAIVCLAAALGLFTGRHGRGALLSTDAFRGKKEKIVYSALADKETRLINMLHLGRALTVLKPPVQCLFVYNSNPLSVAPDGASVRRGLERDDLFTIVHEQVMTPTARFADLLLPATTSFENRDIYTAYGHFYLGLTHPVIEARGEALSNFELFQTLARKMGYSEPPFRQTLEERILDYLDDMVGIPGGLAPTSVGSGEWVRSTLVDLPEADDGQKFSFAKRIENPAVPVIACLKPTEEFDDPDRQVRFPLRLITPPNSRLLNSTFGDQYSEETGKLLIHPADASSRKIKNGDRVRLKNGRGSTVRKARVNNDTQQGLVVAEGIYWENSQTDWTGINDLTSQKTTDLGEGSTFHESLVEIEHAGDR